MELKLEKGKPPEKTGRKVTDLSLRVGGYGGRTAGQPQESSSKPAKVSVIIYRM
jgi:hypothetical protein